MAHTVATLADLLGAEITGPAHLEIKGLNTLELARPGDMTFIGSERHASSWVESSASAAVVSTGIDVDGHDPGSRALLRVDDADLAMAELLALFAPAAPLPPAGVSEHAHVDPSADIDPSASIAHGCTIGARVKIGAGTILEPNVFIGDETTVGEQCVLRTGVVIRERCTIGNRVSMHANAVIGTDGFGYRPDGRGGLVKMPHIGSVIIHDDVEIGAGSTIDRGKFGDTVIGEHTKLDNLVQIGHNVRIGRGCVFSSLSGVAGSSVIGDYCQLAAQAGVSDHVTLGNGVRVAAASGIMRDAEDGETLGGIPAVNIRDYWRTHSATSKLAELLPQLRRIVAEHEAKNQAPAQPDPGSDSD